MKRLLITILAALFLAAPAAADVVKTVSTEYYTVKGKSPKAIYEELKRHSPLNEGAQTYQANTRTSIKYNYKWEKRGGKCTMKDATVYLHLTYLYPRLTHSVDRKTRNWWKSFLGKLEEHELIHGEISIKAAHEMSDALEALGTMDCNNFKATVKSRADRIMEKLKKAQVIYDQLTEHGLKQERNRGQFP